MLFLNQVTPVITFRELEVLRVEYRKAVMPGSIISPSIVYSPGTAHIVLAVEDAVCCVIEFTLRS